MNAIPHYENFSVLHYWNYAAFECLYMHALYMLISDWIFDVFKSPKKPTKFLTDFCPSFIVERFEDTKILFRDQLTFRHLSAKGQTSMDEKPQIVICGCKAKRLILYIFGDDECVPLPNLSTSKIWPKAASWRDYSVRLGISEFIFIFMDVLVTFP